MAEPIWITPAMVQVIHDDKVLFNRSSGPMGVSFLNPTYKIGYVKNCSKLLSASF